MKKNNFTLQSLLFGLFAWLLCGQIALTAQTLSDIKPWEQVAAERLRTQTINHSREIAVEAIRCRSIRHWHPSIMAWLRATRSMTALLSGRA